MISVVIPAHDEEQVIAELLEALHPGVRDGRLEVVVVANGCSDRTAEIAGGFDGVMVVERGSGGKTGALNEGDRNVSSFPRFYVDADVVIDAGGFELLAQALHGDVVAVAPSRTLDSAGSSGIVRSYHRIWDRLDSTVRSLAGRGCYGVSEPGRARWGEFPDLIADDGFVNTLFAPDERANVDGVATTVVAPENLRQLLARKRRSHSGNVELNSDGAAVTSNTGWLDVLRREPTRLLDAPAYVLVTILARVLSAVDRRRGEQQWGSVRATG